MPLDEEGAKWSCEPCIRGHRSSKCQHFDRLMMKVPKAGRPLAKCPHPKGSCSCQRTYSMMIRIPKGTGCVCRPVDDDSTSQDGESSEAIQPAPAAQSSLSSLTSSPASSKVQKSGRRQGSIQTAPENIARALEFMPANLKLEESSTGLPPVSPYPLQHNGSDFSNSNNSYYSYNPYPYTAPSYAPRQTNGSSCCSKKPPPPPALSSGGGSCCSGKSGSQPTAPLVAHEPALHQHQPTAWDGAADPTSSFSAWHNPTNSAQASIQGRFMRPYGFQENHMSPLYVDSFGPNGNSPAYSNPMNGLGIADSHRSSYTSTPSQYTSNSSQNSTYTPTHISGDPSHDCQCGDQCQCLGCAAHPFNNTTRQRVQEMGEMMTFDGETPELEPYQAPFRHPQPWEQFKYLPHDIRQNPFNSFSDQPHAHPTSNYTGAYSSPVPGGQVMNEQLMHTSEYLTLEYSLETPSTCSDITGSCQCGNDCNCVGCLTHSGHNGLPSPMNQQNGLSQEAPMQESAFPIHHSPNPIVSSHEQFASHTASTQPSRIPVLENVSVPCLSPRTLETSMI